MIEYYSLMYKGDKELYEDNTFIHFDSTITMLILFSGDEHLYDFTHSVAVNSLISSCRGKDILSIRDELHTLVPDTCDYLLLQINDMQINTIRRGRVYAKIIKRGEVRLLPNGKFNLEAEDRIICGTYSFFKELSDTAVLCDAITAISAEEWMDYMVCRISEKTFLLGDNLSAISIIVRED